MEPIVIAFAVYFVGLATGALWGYIWGRRDKIGGYFDGGETEPFINP